MQDRFGDLRLVVQRLNPGGAVVLRQGGSAVVDVLLNRGEHFDLDVHLGTRRITENKAEYMGTVFEKLEDLKGGIAQIGVAMDTIRKLKKQAIEATTTEKEKYISEQLTKILDTSNANILKLKKSLQNLEEENRIFSDKNPNSSEARIRVNLHAAVTRRFKEVLKEYQSVQVDYKREVREKVSRQLRIVFPEASDQQVDELVRGGDSAASAAIRAQLTGQIHQGLQNALEDLRDKYRDIRRLEQSVTELHQMFVDLSTLVDSQGELLDQIEFSVNSAKDYTERAEKELLTTRKHQKAAKRRMCWISVCIVVLAVIVLIPVIAVLTR